MSNWLSSDAPQEYGPIPWPLQWYTSYTVGGQTRVLSAAYWWKACWQCGLHSQSYFEPSEETLPIPLSRHQFPVRVAFAMTINKSQGQSVTHVGLDLCLLSFHMVNFMCTVTLHFRERIKVLFPEGSQASSTLNVVYPEVLLNVLPTPW